MTRPFLVVVALSAVIGSGLGSSGSSRLGAVGLAAQAKFDLTGEWVFDVQTDQGGGSPGFVFKQTGEKLAGKYKGLFGEADLHAAGHIQVGTIGRDAGLAVPPDDRLNRRDRLGDGL